MTWPPLPCVLALGPLLLAGSLCPAQEVAEAAPAAGCQCPVWPGILTGTPPSDWLEAGHWSLQCLSGYYPTSGLGSSGIPFGRGPDGKFILRRAIDFDYAPVDFRLGWVPFGTFFDDTWLRGNGELVLEYAADPVLREFGHFMTGPSLLLRWNFQQSECRLVPYIQCGTGIVFDDAYHRQDQRLIGGPTEFLLQAQVGLRYFLSPSLSLDAEGGYQHISNADTYARNVGVNNFGGSVGFTYHFRCGRREAKDCSPGG